MTLPWTSWCVQWAELHTRVVLLLSHMYILLMLRSLTILDKSISMSLRHHNKSSFLSDIDECSPSPCLNGGTCMDQVNGYICSCSIAATGALCETGESLITITMAPRSRICDNSFFTLTTTNRIKKIATLLALRERNLLMTGGFPSERVSNARVMGLLPHT